MISFFRNEWKRTFVLFSIGTATSLLGSILSGFAIGVWVFQHTNSVTQFALIPFFATISKILISPLAGGFVDRWNRRRVMILSDSGSALCTLAMAILFAIGRLEIWHIYSITIIRSAFDSFQAPAYSASISLLVPKQYLGKANGIAQMGFAFAQLAAPIMAGFLVATIQIYGVFLIDFITFAFNLSILMLIRIPQPDTMSHDLRRRGSFLSEIGYGWTYITAYPGMIGLLMFFTAGNILVGTVSVLATPLVLSFASPAVLGTLLSVGGIGMLIGSLVMSFWGGPKRLIYGVLSSALIEAIFIIIGGLKPSAALLGAAAFGFFFCQPIVSSCSRTILQAKVPPEIQGRVFSLGDMLTSSALVLANLIAGPLADRLFEPMLTPNGLLAPSVGRLIGVGTGRGIGFMFIVMGILTILLVVVAYCYPRLRLLEDEIPDNAVRLEINNSMHSTITESPKLI